MNIGSGYEQISIFDLLFPTFHVERKIRLIELFAGVGSQAMALRDMGVDFEHYRISEWEVNANRSYKAIHHPGKTADYSGKFKKFKWLVRVLYEYGISADGKARLTLEQIRRKGEKWCRQTYNEFRANRNIGSIVNAHALDLRISDTDKYCYIMTYSFPCQDLSVAGKQKGMAKGSGTRSGLLWEVERLLNECSELPQVLLMENVPQVHSKANMPDFQKWIDFLESKGYSSYWQDLNAKDYGVAQNRNRCFMVSLLGEWNYRFPQSIPLERKLKDFLEDEVGEKYYIDTEKAQKLMRTLIENGTLRDGVLYPNDADFEMDGNFNQRGKVHGEESVCRTIMGSGHAGNEPKIFVDLSLNNPNKKTVSNCITSGDRGISNQHSVGNGVVEMNKVKQIENMDVGRENFNIRNVASIDSSNLSPTINTCQGGQREPKIIVAMRGRNLNNPSDRTMGSPTEQRLEPNSQGICNTLTNVQKDNMLLIKQATRGGYIECECGGVADLSFPDSSTRRGRVQDKGSICPAITAESNGLCRIENQYRIRKLTPKECWRLMGFSDWDFQKAEEVNSSTQLYKQAGNSLVKTVMAAILSQLNIKGIKAWNSMDSKERDDFIEEVS